MKRPRLLWVAAALAAGVGIALATLATPSLQDRRRHQQAARMPSPTQFVEMSITQLSGVAFHPQRGTLLVESDQGQIAEMNLQYRTLRQYDIPGDIEGLCVHPQTGTLFVASESDGAVIEYDLDAGRVLRTLLIDFSTHPDFAAGLTRNKGLEGVAVVTTPAHTYRLYAAVEAKPARVIVLSADISPAATERARHGESTDPFVGMKETIQVTASYDVGLRRISDLGFDAESGTLLVVSSGERTLTLCDLNGRRLRSVRLPGRKPEGFCFLPNGDALVAQDTGGLWVCQGLRPALFAPREKKEPAWRTTPKT